MQFFFRVPFPLSLVPGPRGAGELCVHWGSQQCLQDLGQGGRKHSGPPEAEVDLFSFFICCPSQPGVTGAGGALLETHRLCLSEAFKSGSGLWDVVLVWGVVAGIYPRQHSNRKRCWMDDLFINLLTLRLTDTSTYFGVARN